MNLDMWQVSHWINTLQTLGNKFDQTNFEGELICDAIGAYLKLDLVELELPLEFGNPSICNKVRLKGTLHQSSSW